MFFCCVWAALGEDAVEAAKSKNAWDGTIQFVTKGKDQCNLRVTEQEEFTRLRVECQGSKASYWCELEGKPKVCRNYNANPRHFFTQIMWDLRKLQNACNGQQIIKPPMCKKASDEAQMVMTAGASAARKTAVSNFNATQSPSAKKEQVKPEQTKQESPSPAEHPGQAKPEQGKTNGPRQKPLRQKPVKPQPTRSQPVRLPKVKPEEPRTEQAKPDQGKPTVFKTPAKSTTLKKTVTIKTTIAPTTPALTKTAENLAHQYCWTSMKDFCTQVISWFKN